MDWINVIQNIFIWILAQGFLSLWASKISQWFFSGVRRGWKVFIVYLISLLLAIAELIGSQTIDLKNFNWNDVVQVLGLMQIIYIGAEIYWRKIFKPIEEKIIEDKLIEDFDKEDY